MNLPHKAVKLFLRERKKSIAYLNILIWNVDALLMFSKRYLYLCFGHMTSLYCYYSKQISRFKTKHEKPKTNDHQFYGETIYPLDINALKWNKSKFATHSDHVKCCAPNCPQNRTEHFSSVKFLNRRLFSSSWDTWNYLFTIHLMLVLFFFPK